MTITESDKYINKKEDFHIDITTLGPEEWSPRHRKSPSIKLKEAMGSYLPEIKKQYLYENKFSPELENIYMIDMLKKHVTGDEMTESLKLWGFIK
ncbi:hypothetical protein ACT1UH_01865 [Mycoplasma sp. 332]|uniref:hypothetical protein n=1 Tax=Mycoplasma sp. 332 TaxID=3458236 RepID=UPI0040368728